MDRNNNAPLSHIAIPYGTQLIGMILVFVAFLMLIAAISSFFKYQAMENCTHISRVEQTLDEGKTKVTYPDEKLYTRCLQQVGIK